MTLEFKIGKEKQTVDVDERYLLGILKPGEIPPEPAGDAWENCVPRVSPTRPCVIMTQRQ